MSLLYLSEIPHAFPQEPTWQTTFVGIVGLLQHSFAARVSVRGHLGHHNCFQRRCTLHVLFKVDKHSPSWALRDRQLRSDVFCCCWNTFCHTPESFPVRDNPGGICMRFF